MNLRYTVLGGSKLKKKIMATPQITAPIHKMRENNLGQKIL